MADANAGMGIAVGDYDGSGGVDLVVTNLREQGHAVYRNTTGVGASPSFDDERDTAGVDLTTSSGWGASWADLDLDTDLDAVLVNGHVPVRDIVEDAEEPQALENHTAQGDVGRFADWSDGSGIADLGPA